MTQQNYELEKLNNDSTMNTTTDPAAKESIREIIKRQLKENILLVATIVAVMLGIGIGFLLRAFFEFNDNQISYFGFVGQLFLRMLKFLILPLIATSLISGIAGLSKNAGRIALRALVYYFSTTITAVVIGIILVVIIRPGSGKGSDVDANLKVPIDTNKYVTTHDTLLDLIRNLFPDNIVEMTFREYQTEYTPIYKYNLVNVTSNHTIVVKELPKNLNGDNFEFSILKSAKTNVNLIKC
jgi:L-cystine uptake protein TcyP (sodium:dicarboxylate symporter family)